MAAIAQTLDGAETFNTKAELFDYVITQLSDFDCQIYVAEGVSCLQIGELKIEVENVEVII